MNESIRKRFAEVSLELSELGQHDVYVHIALMEFVEGRFKSYKEMLEQLVIVLAKANESLRQDMVKMINLRTRPMVIVPPK